MGHDYKRLVEMPAWAHLSKQLTQLREAQVAILAYSKEVTDRDQAEARATIKVIDSFTRVPSLMIETAAESERDLRQYRS